MTLAPGTRCGVYEIQSALGRGGMGEVHRARDTKLGRDVAIKALPESFRYDAERVARFEREAQLLASLNHPHIATIYGLEEASGQQFLIMELVEGDTLAERLTAGPLPVSEALTMARQIADALQAAHEKGIIHRDLKPANIALTAEGQVKVLDFGLAKALEAGGATGAGRAGRAGEAGGLGALSESPTITSPAMMTGVGVLLGTAAYMAPEQAKGRPADKRSDVWAFGCVLYEMLTGRRAFEGEDVSDTLAAVLRADPDWTELPQGVSVPVLTMLRSCLEKDRRKRMTDIGGALFVLDHAASLLERVEVPVPGPPDPAYVQAQTDAAVAAVRRELGASMRRRVTLVSASASFAAAAIAIGSTWFALQPAPPRVSRLVITTSGATALAININDRDLAITPDGSRIVYRGNNQLLVRALDQLEPTVLSGLGAPRGVFISPDGQWVGFFDGNSVIKKVAITGGPPVTVGAVDGAGPRGATWGADGTIVYATTLQSTGLQRVSATGGSPTVLTKPDRARGEGDHVWPEFLPNGQAVLFTITATTGGLEAAQIAAFDLRTGTQKVLIRGGSHAYYVPSGHLVYGIGSTLRAVAFDPDRLEVVGTPVPVLEEMMTTAGGAADLTFAENGTMAYVPGRAFALVARSIVWVDRMGREEPLAAPARAYQYARISPDGTRVALDIRDQENDVWIWDLTRQTLTRLTFDAALDGGPPLWTPDSRRVIFTSQRVGVGNLFWQAADGTGTVERLSESSNPQLTQSITPNGTHLVLREVVQATAQDLVLMPLQPPRRTQPLVQTKFDEPNAEVSPDGRWFAYESTESGRAEVYVRPFPDVNSGRWQVSTGGGRIPLWSRNGRELFYVSPENALMGVRVEAGSTWRSSTPARVLQGEYLYSIPALQGGFGGATGRSFDIAPNGRRFLMIKQSGSAGARAPQHLIVVQNWFEELKRLVPVN